LILGTLKRIKDIFPTTLEEIIQRPMENMDREEIELFASFLRALLKFEPAERPTATLALKHPWLQ
jgi:serine/threonine protein kinase